MRLTLRTLLAYRDGVLSPQHQEDLHQRIQQNRPIASLLQQINELVRSSELLTPKLQVSGIGDANVIAEYLDDALSGETVAELERLCLQNADHLCELAHCHQLLAEAMSTHVRVPDSLQDIATGVIDPTQRELVRSRLLTKSGNKPVPPSPGTDSSLRQELASGQVPSDPVVTGNNAASPETEGEDAQERGSQVDVILPVNSMSPMLTADGGAIRQAGLDLESTPLASEVPAYLLASQRKRWQIPAAIVTLTLLLVLLIWQSIGSVDSLRSLWLAASIETDTTVTTDPLDASRSENTSQRVPATKSDPKIGTAIPDVPTKGLQSLDDRGTIDPQESDAAIAASGELPVAVESAEELQSESLADRIRSEAESGDKDLESALQPAEQSQTSTVESTVQSVGLRIQAGDSHQGRAVVFVSPNSREITRGALQLLGEHQQPIMTGRIIVPPSVRVPLQIGSWQWTVGGATSAVVDLESSSPVLESRLLRGIFTCIDKTQPLTLKTPVGSFELTLLEPTAWLAVEVAARPIVRGSMTEPNTYVPVVIVVAGSDAAEESGELARVRVVEGNQTFVFRNAAQGLAVIGEQAATEFNLQNPPRWYGRRSIRLIDQEASQDFYSALRNRQIPIGEQIDQLVRHERPELAAMAIQSSLLLGNWRPLVSELLVADRLRAHWTPTLELARQLAVGNPMVQTTVEELLQEDFGTEARRLSELFLGLTKQQLESEGLSTLLKGIESESLSLRILSANELTLLTGSDHGYLPHAPVKATIQQIRRLQSTGKLSIRPVTDPIWERTPQL